MAYFLLLLAKHKIEITLTKFTLLQLLNMFNFADDVINIFTDLTLRESITREERSTRWSRNSKRWCYKSSLTIKRRKKSQKTVVTYWTVWTEILTLLWSPRTEFLLGKVWCCFWKHQKCNSVDFSTRVCNQKPNRWELSVFLCTRKNYNARKIYFCDY